MLVSLIPLVLAAAQDPVEDEWRVRRWALEESAREGLGPALEAGDWRVRVAALDACERALEAGRPLPPEWDPLLRESLGHAHGNVRAGALRVFRALGARGARVVLDSARVEQLAADLLPDNPEVIEKILEQ